MTETFPDLMQKDFSQEDIIAMLGATSDDEIEVIRSAAEKVLLENCGNEVYTRGLIEASNICRCNCYYCGIRKSNKNVERYDMKVEEIVDAALWCVDHGYGSMVIQAGERHSARFIDRIEEALKQIKQQTRSEELPQGLGITLGVGEQTPEVYRRFFEAGAHRYLLRVETTNPDLFEKIHPSGQTLETRIDCLNSLREVGYQVGTGVMIGLPGQTLEDLANDILFFKRQDIDMIGMGPFIPNEETPLGRELCPDVCVRMNLALLMIAVTRLVLKDVNIASTTALEALDPEGREAGLRFGANVIMPLMTPQSVRRNYLLYPGKPCLDEDLLASRTALEKSINSVGREMVANKWGDAVHFKKRNLNKGETTS